MTSPPGQGSPSRPFFRGKFASLSTLFFLAIGGAFLFFLVVRFDISPRQIWDSLRDSNPWFFLLAFFLYYTNFVFRGIKWRILLGNARQHGEPSPSVPHTTSLMLISGFVNLVTAFRLGDAYRAYLYSSESKTSFSRAVGTLVAERAVEVVIMFSLLMLAAVLLATHGDETSWIYVALASILPGVLIVGLLAMRLFRGRIQRFVPGPLKAAYDLFHHGALGSYANLPLLVGLAVLGWLAEVGRVFFVAQALGVDLSFAWVLFAALANALLTLLPVGGLGITEVSLASLLSDTLTRSEAGAVVVLDRVISYLSVIIFGGLLFLVHNAVFRKRATVSPPG
ncbi:MAG: flippase-like domain-containing protein [SAR202 cluster bacterium]|nr:flippase-like domain-containing protein [SAR202 cluster bacterium]